MNNKNTDLYSKVTELNRINTNLKTELMRFDLIVKCYEKLIVILDKFRDNNSFNINYDLNERNEELLLRQKLISLKSLKLNNDFINNNENIATHEDQNESQCELSLINTESEIADIIPKQEIEDKNTTEYDSDKSIPEEKPKKKKKKTNKKDKKEYKCDVIGCEDKVFKSEFFLKRHQLIHNPKECARKRFVCDFKDCGQRFVDNYKLKRHKASHSDEKPFKCRYKGCGVQFKRKDKLNEHQKRHKNNFRSMGIDEEAELDLLIPETILEEGDHMSENVRILPNNDSNDGELRNHFSHSYKKETEKMSEDESQCDYSVIPENMVEKPDYLFEKINDIFKCKFIGCLFETKQFLNFQKHYLKHLPNADNYKRYKCEFVGCGLKFFDKYRLTCHQSIHNSETRYKCDRIGCVYETKRPDLLANHKERHIHDEEELMLGIFEGNLAKNPSRKFVCDFKDCKKAYFCERSLASHKKIHDAKPEDFIVCGINGCEKKFNLLFNGINKVIESHQIDSHPEMFPGIEYKICTQTDCEFKTKSIKQMRVHMKAHKREEKLVCSHKECGKEFTDKSLYKSHMKVHMGFRFVCDVENCGKKFCSDSTLRKHKNLHKEKPLACAWVGCEEKFYCDYLLKEHLNIHTGEKPFSCAWPGCGKMFATKNHLYCHMRTHSDKMLACDWPECGFRTRKRNRLNEHFAKHTGEKSFVCEWPGCGFATVYKWNLVKHQRHMHKMDL